MALSPILGAFTWGEGGSKLTPEEIAVQRALFAKKRLQGVDTSPVASPWQGAARLADAFGDVMQENRLGQAAAENAAYNQSQAAPIMDALYGGITGTSNPVAAALTSGPGVAQEMAATSPAMDISGDQQQFVSALLPAAIEESKRTGVDPRIIVGQAALETGWGKSAPGNNYFGIKSHGQAGGNTMATTEVVNGQPVRIRDSFRAYESPADSVRGYGDFILQNPRYEGLRNAQGLDGQLSALQASGYATDPNYGSKVGTIARGIQLPETPQAAIESAAPISGNPTVSASDALPALPVRKVGAAPSVASQPVQVAQNTPQVPRALIAQSLAVMQDPRATPQTKSVAQALLERQQSYNEAAQKQALAEQQRQQDIARRQAVAQQTGINPAYAQDEDIWKAAAGNVFAAPSVTNVNGVVYDNRTSKPLYGSPDKPVSVQEFEYGQRTPGYFEQQQALRRSGATNLNTGTIPIGYEQFTDPVTNAVSMRRIPGGPEDRSLQNAAAAENKTTSTDVIVTAAQRARDAAQASGMPATGSLGKIMSNLPESNAAELRRQVSVLTSNAKIENLNAMRAASPTGGALGAVSDSESAMLAAKAGAIDPDSPNFLRDVDDYEHTMLRIVHGQKAGDAIFEQTRGVAPAGKGTQPKVINGYKIEEVH